ncbi:MAG: hypothetical protein R3B51_13545 [Thermodesulfobacteriota bacterium]
MKPTSRTTYSTAGSVPIENLDELASKLGQKAGIAEFGIFIGTAKARL